MSTNEMDAAHCQRNLELPGRRAFRQTSGDNLVNVNRDEENHLGFGQGHSLGSGPEIHKLEILSRVLASFLSPVYLYCGLI